MTHPAAWLPPELSSVVMRLGRCDEAVYKIAELARSWSTTGDGPLTILGVRYPDGRIDYVVDAVRPIPPMVPLLFSEAINHLRSAIENTLFYLVEKRRGESLPEKQAKRVSMPILADGMQFNAWLEANDKADVPELGQTSVIGSRIRLLQPFVDVERVPSISEELAAMIGVQPVYESPLVLLRNYSNSDKHRIALAAAARSAVSREAGPFVAEDHVMKAVAIGDVIGSAAPGERVVITSNSGVHVQRPGSSTWVGPSRELDRLRRHVSDNVLPVLVKGLALPASLPPNVDLSDNGESDAARIEGGGWTSGADRATTDVATALFDSMMEEPTSPPIIEAQDYRPESG